MFKTPITTGMVVLCHDNGLVEAQLETGKQYVVSDVSHRGVLLKVEGVPQTFASTRFTPLAPPTTNNTPTEMGLANAGNY
jgi:hypothetical protein